MKNTYRAVALCAVVLGLSSLAGAVDKTACVEYSGRAAVQGRGNNLRKCGFTGSEWTASSDYHFEWCMQGRSAEELKKQLDDRRNLLKICEERHKREKPPETECQRYKLFYDNQWRSVDADKMECKQLAGEKKPTIAAREKLLKDCDTLYSHGKLFYDRGCDRTYPTMSAPPPGSNTCHHQAKTACP